MKHIFIINPAAGKGDAEKVYLPMIEKITEIGEINHEIHFSEPDGEIVRFVRERCLAREKMETLRFYACGGDGTLNEVARGMQGFSDAQAAVIPSGTGNDFVRNFTNPEYFVHPERQIKGEALLMDGISYRIKGEPGEQYEPHEQHGQGGQHGQGEQSKNAKSGIAVNMCNIGADSETAWRVHMLKKYPFMTGSAAYLASLLSVLVGKLGIELAVTFDDGTQMEGAFLLAAFGNGVCYGGGFQATPKANLHDGLMDVCMVKQISKARIASFVSAYKNGRHLENEKLKQYVTYKQCKYLRVSCKNSLKLCIDGEHIIARDFDLTVKPDVLPFSVPMGCHCKTDV